MVRRRLNGKGVPYEALTDAVVTALQDAVFNPVNFGQLFAAQLNLIDEQVDERRERLEAARRDVVRLDGALTGLAEAVAEGGPVPVLLAAIQAKERQRDAARGVVAALEAEEAARESFDLAAWIEETRELFDAAA